jgi:hypothetical protein
MTGADFGSTERTGERVAGTVEFISAPMDTIVHAARSTVESMNSARAEGRFYDVGRTVGSIEGSALGGAIAGGAAPVALRSMRKMGSLVSKPRVIVAEHPGAPNSVMVKPEAWVITEQGAADSLANTPEIPTVTPDYGSGKGRRGTIETRAHIDQVRDDFLRANPNYRHVAGGTSRVTGEKIREEYLPGADGGRKGGSYADLTFEAPDGTRIRINTVDVDANGAMTLRERQNFDRIHNQTGQTVIAIPKPSQARNKAKSNAEQPQ